MASCERLGLLCPVDSHGHNTRDAYVQPSASQFVLGSYSLWKCLENPYTSQPYIFIVIYLLFILKVNFNLAMRWYGFRREVLYYSLIYDR